MAKITLPPAGKKSSAVQTDEPVARKGESPPKTKAGFLLLDSSLRPLSVNAEAIEILSYPDKLANLSHHNALLGAKIQSGLVSPEMPDASPLVTEFRSGRRRYFCRSFFVESFPKDPSLTRIAVLLERGPSALTPLSLVSSQFNLTQREQEALGYLLQGLSSKGIADRMHISPNTVKAYMRMIMIKTGVSSRSAIVTKIVLAQPQ
jgi:DNA-binding CsgD family transcriptional regulator